MLDQTIRYLGVRANRLGRVLFRSDAGALTLEWIVIAAALVAAVAAAAVLFNKAIKTEAGKL